MSVVLGGVGSVPGVVLGAIIISLLPNCCVTPPTTGFLSSVYS
ncbi:hypothetical protein [Nonomuraea dietziae]